MRFLQKVQHCLVKELFSLTSEVQALRSLVVPDKIRQSCIEKLTWPPGKRKSPFCQLCFITDLALVSTYTESSFHKPRAP